VPLSRDFHYVYNRVPRKGSCTSSFRLKSSHRADAAFSEPFFARFSKPPVNEPTSMFSSEALMERFALFRSLFYISSMVPSKVALPPSSLAKLPKRKKFCFQSPPNLSLKVPGQTSPLKLTQEAYIKRDARFQSLVLQMSVYTINKVF